MVNEEHIPLSQHLQALALKVFIVTVFGDYFKDDKDIIELRRNFDIVSRRFVRPYERFNSCIVNTG